MPNTIEAYIHRIGRTGRADKSGEAYTLITQEDSSEVRNIERVLGNKLELRQLDDFDYTATGPSRGNLGSITQGRFQKENARRWK
jgi:ATP-dependent RNA helicase RhlE